MNERVERAKRIRAMILDLEARVARLNEGPDDPSKTNARTSLRYQMHDLREELRHLPDPEEHCDVESGGICQECMDDLI